jgi:hypothetical protein
VNENPVIAFYTGIGKDHRGRRLEDILAFNDEKLESVHDFIQWLFPLEVKSPVNPYAPICVKEIEDNFKTNDYLKGNLCKACSRMLAYYGLHCQPTEKSFSSQTVSVAQPEKLDNWLSPNNHNQLRLTRMLKSLRLLGLERCSNNLYQCLMEIASANPSRVSQVTLCYWTDSQKKNM